MIAADEGFHGALGAAAARVEEALADFLPADDTALGAAMRHAVLGGGKRIRAFLAMESAALFRVPASQALRTAAAVECMHAYSLVHDDLPCMDDDQMRRGQPTVHVKWDEATAVLAGDALQTLAFDILSRSQTGLDPRVQLRLVQRLAEASGAHGMAGGQALDIQAETAALPLTLEETTALQGLKTGALIGWAAESGAILGRSQPEPLLNYAAALGLAFQIRDDILDVEGEAEVMGKRVGKDAGRGKATFVSLMGLEAARERARALVAEACENLKPYGSAAERLRQLAHFAVERPG